MSCQRSMPSRCSIHCILPPHVLETMIQRGSFSREKLPVAKNAKADRRITWALQNLGINNTFSHARVGFDESMRLTRQAARAQRLLGAARADYLKAVTGGQPNRTIR